MDVNGLSLFKVIKNINVLEKLLMKAVMLSEKKIPLIP
jgi:hypothetical protein